MSIYLWNIKNKKLDNLYKLKTTFLKDVENINIKIFRDKNILNYI